MFGFGPRINQVFRSRWKALGWSLGVLLTAYCTVPVADQARKHKDAKVAAAHAAHKSPWSKDR